MQTWRKYLLWIVGLFVLLEVYGRIGLYVHRIEAATFDVAMVAVVYDAALFILGLYLSLLFIRSSRKLNVALLTYVFVPSVIVACYDPVALMVGLPIMEWMTPLLQFSPLLAGVSLMFAFYGQQ